MNEIIRPTTFYPARKFDRTIKNGWSIRIVVETYKIHQITEIEEQVPDSERNHPGFCE